MATVYLGRLAGPGGFSRLVAIKRPHPHVAQHPEFRAMLLDEGRLAASISHPNVVSTLDVVAEGDDLFLVMEYVPGETLAQLQRIVRARSEAIPAPIACAVLHGVLLGLWAVHSARDDRGEPLGIVHRDISPQNILVGKDGVARVLDFGVAKAAGRLQITRDGQLKGKIAYMAPEQMQGSVTARTDIYAASIVFWEALTARRLFTGEDDVEIFSKALTATVAAPSTHGRAFAGGVLDTEGWAALDAVVLRGLARNPPDRFATAKEMAAALDECVTRASAAEVSAWLQRMTEGSVEEPAALGAERSDVATVTDESPGRPVATLTESGRHPLAVRVSRDVPPAPIPALVPRPRSRSRALLALGIGAVSVVGIILFTTYRSAPVVGASRGDPSASAPSISALPAVSPSVPSDTPAPEEAPRAAATTASGTRLSPGVPGSSPAHAKPGPKNRVEHALHVPVPSQGIDVSHAIDQRH